MLALSSRDSSDICNCFSSGSRLWDSPCSSTVCSVSNIIPLYKHITLLKMGDSVRIDRLCSVFSDVM